MKILTSAENAVFSAFQNETLLMAMGLLTTIMTDEELVMSVLWCVICNQVVGCLKMRF